MTEYTARKQPKRVRRESQRAKYHKANYPLVTTLGCLVPCFASSLHCIIQTRAPQQEVDYRGYSGDPRGSTSVALQCGCGILGSFGTTQILKWV